MLYEYICDTCEFTDSYFHKMNETPEIICPDCGNKMRKVLGLNFVLNGSGYYSSSVDTSRVQRVKQTVVGYDENQLDKVDNKIKKAPRAKPVEPV